MESYKKIHTFAGIKSIVIVVELVTLLITKA